VNLAATEATRRVAHIDMDAFYASVELLRHPALRGAPVVIGGGRRRGDGAEERGDYRRLRDYAGRGVVTTATYAARAFGVHSGMGLMKAARLCPDAILLPMDFEQYQRCSRAFKDIVLRHAPRMQDRGIDEVYAEFTDAPGGLLEGGRVLAARIQQEIETATGLTCSIGVAPNKLLAKLASEFQKPRGITILQADDLATRIWPLECRKLNGVGPKATAKLQSLGLHTIGDVAARERDWLRERFGESYGAWLHDAAHGRDDRPVITCSEPVSMSRETTFERDLHAVHDRATLGALFTSLCERVARDLQDDGYLCRTVGIKLRYDNFRTVTRALTLPAPVADAVAIRRAAGECLKRVPLDRRLRLLGVRAANLCKPDAVAPPLRVAEPELWDALKPQPEPADAVAEADVPVR
jgi:DNA polymerase-4